MDTTVLGVLVVFGVVTAMVARSRGRAEDWRAMVQWGLAGLLLGPIGLVIALFSRPGVRR